ncbi:unnamed protein product [Arabidopsis thaliana]|uniref:(thale cress) hypothetical protein n=1 Tax=Arabidopsis thaliana TaxID=3702 RepID=A0A7G2ENN3_ARATH|nr:unnamed protein product [Arabidopsis thaliana]
MKVELVFIPSPGVGHIRATTALAKLLVASDNRLSVTLIVIPSRVSDDASSSVYTNSEDRLRYILLPARDQTTDLVSYIDSQKPQVRAVVSKLAGDVSTRSDSRLAGIVVDMFCTSMIDIADEFNLSAYIFYTSNASYLGLQFHVQSLYDEKELDVSEFKDTEMKFDVPTLTQPFPAKCLPSVMLNKKWFPYVLGRARSFRATKGILVNSVADMEPQALSFFSGGNGNTNIPPVYAVGPIMDLESSGDEEKRKEILHWLKEQPTKSVVFLCFGSMGGFSEEQAREIAVALERSGHRFLWSLRRASPLVFIPSPGDGHLRPLVEVAKLLVDRDDHLSITIIIIPQMHGFSSSNSSSYIASLSSDSEERLSYNVLSVPDKPDSDDTKPHFFDYIDNFKPQVKATVEKLTDPGPPDSPSRLAGFVVDMFCMMMIDVANEFGVPSYMFYTSNATFLGLQVHVEYLYDVKNYDVSDLKDSDTTELEVPCLTRPLPVKCFPSVLLTKEWLPVMFRQTRRFRETKGILVNTFAELEPQAMKFFSGVDSPLPTVYTVGPVMNLKINGPNSSDDKQSEILRWLDEQPRKSVVFLCFGSMGGFREGQAKEIAIALERSGHRFVCHVALMDGGSSHVALLKFIQDVTKNIS